ncbi:MAG: hypothetical protein ACR2PV_00630 [Gammaproteobacteria bacterium]
MKTDNFNTAASGAADKKTMAGTGQSQLGHRPQMQSRTLLTEI